MKKIWLALAGLVLAFSASASHHHHHHGSLQDSEVNQEAKPEVKPEVKPETHINLKVSDGSSEIFFKIKKTTPLRRLMEAFAKRQGKEMDSLTFLYDGIEIQADQTPEDLDMEDNDIIEAHREQIGGLTCLICPEKHCNKVHTCLNGEKICFKKYDQRKLLGKRYIRGCADTCPVRKPREIVECCSTDKCNH